MKYIILENWNLNLNIKEIQRNIWNVGNKYILKSFDNIETVDKNIKLTKLLTKNSIKVPDIIKTVDKKDYIKIDNNYYILFELIDGIKIIDLFNKNYKKIAKESARFIKNLHIGLRNIEKEIELKENHILYEMKTWIYEELKINNWDLISQDEYNNLLKKLEILSASLATQLIHRDLHLGNLLYKEESFVGYIDFDLSEKNLRIFDISYFLLSIISENTEIMDDSKKWNEFYNVFLEEYNISEKNLTKEEIEGVPLVMKSIELLFAAYFSRVDNINFAKNAMDIYRFLDNNFRVK